MAVIACPSCGVKAKMAPEKLGRRLRCPRCRITFIATATGSAAPNEVPVPSSAPRATPQAAATKPAVPVLSLAQPGALAVGAGAGGVPGTQRGGVGTMGYQSRVAPRWGRARRESRIPQWVRAMLTGGAVGAGYGALLYGMVWLILIYSRQPAGDIAAGGAMVLVGLAALAGMIFHLVYGMIIGVVVGLSQSSVAGYVVAMAISAAGVFFLRAGACSLLFSVLFAWIVITTIRKDMDV